LVATKDSNLSKIFKVTLRIIIYVLVQFQRKLKTVNLFYRTPNKKRTVFQKNPRVGKNTNNDTFCICIDAARNGQPLRTKPQQQQQCALHFNPHRFEPTAISDVFLALFFKWSLDNEAGYSPSNILNPK